MITVSLDEYGDFEGKKNIKDAVFIGGVMYDDMGIAGETGTEGIRIAAYYRAVMDKLNRENTNENMHYSYPKSLHCGDGVGELMVANTKKLVADTLPEFLRYGTFEGQELVSHGANGINIPLTKREGKYKLFLILKSDEGKKCRKGENANFLVDDDYASNLYFHMASEVFSRILFNNPVIEGKNEFSLQIATRTSGNLLRDGEERNQYENLGFEAYEKINDKDVKTNDKQPGVFFKVTTCDIYRTVIEQLLMDNPDCTNTIKELRVESIHYYINKKMKTQEFLYLADSVCSVLSFELNKKANSADKYMKEIIKRGENLVDSDDLIFFAYDNIDTSFDSAVEAYRNGDYFKALSILFEAEKSDSVFARFYRDRWFKYVKQMIEVSGNVRAFRKAVTDLYNYLMTNRFVQMEGIYILDVLEKMVPYVKANMSAYENKDVFYRLYECGLTIANHNGDAFTVEKYYEKMSAYAGLVGVEEYLRVRNLLTVSYCDSFEWGKAVNMAEASVIYQNHIAEVKREIAEILMPEGFVEQNKALSQLGQVYAFKNDPKAEKVFEEALSNLAFQSANYYITLSYLLQYYLSAGMRDKYEHYASIYFGNNSDREKQLAYIFEENFKKEPAISCKYALYIYIKSLYLFDNESITDSLWEKLSDIEKYVNSNYSDALNNGPWKMASHPYEIIIKYLRLISIERMDKVAEKRYELIYESSMREYSSALLEAIWRMGNAEVLNAKRKKTKRNEEAMEAFKICKKAFRSFKRVKVADEEVYDYMIGRLTYMYS